MTPSLNMCRGWLTECLAPWSLALTAASCLIGCTVEGSTPPGQTTACENTITGEHWTAKSENVRDVRIGFAGAPTCATETDDAGKVRHLCSDDPGLKCWATK